MAHLLQVRSLGLRHEGRCAQRGCGFFYDAVDTDYSRAEFAERAKQAYARWHAAAPRRIA